MQIGKEGLDLIKDKEGLAKYEKINGKWTGFIIAYGDISNIPTIGWGHTASVNGKSIKIGVTKITVAQAEQLLKQDIKHFEDAINSFVKVKLTQNQFDALMSFTYNNGIEGLKNLIKSSGLNNENYAEVPAHMIKYIKVQAVDEKSGKPLFDKNKKPVLVDCEDLEKRRKQEIVLFNKK